MFGVDIQPAFLLSGLLLLNKNAGSTVYYTDLGCSQIMLINTQIDIFQHIEEIV